MGTMIQNKRTTVIEYNYKRKQFQVTWFDMSFSYYNKLEDAVKSIENDFNRFLRK